MERIRTIALHMSKQKHVASADQSAFDWHLRCAIILPEGLRGMTKATSSLHEVLDTFGHLGLPSKSSKSTRRGCCGPSHAATPRETLVSACHL
jgi:hypothetical protein